jgi:hypothetical protein
MENYKAGGEKGNSNLFATNRLFKKSPLFRKRKKKAPGVYDPKAKYRFDKGGALLTKKVTCKKCGWEWDAADGGDDITTCHKCGGQGLVHAKNGGLNKFVGGGKPCPEGYEWDEELQACIKAFEEVKVTPEDESWWNRMTRKVGKAILDNSVSTQKNKNKEQTFDEFRRDTELSNMYDVADWATKPKESKPKKIKKPTKQEVAAQKLFDKADFSESTLAINKSLNAHGLTTNSFTTENGNTFPIFNSKGEYASPEARDFMNNKVNKSIQTENQRTNYHDGALEGFHPEVLALGPQGLLGASAELLTGVSAHAAPYLGATIGVPGLTVGNALTAYGIANSGTKAAGNIIEGEYFDGIYNAGKGILGALPFTKLGNPELYPVLNNWRSALSFGTTGYDTALNPTNTINDVNLIKKAPNDYVSPLLSPPTGPTVFSKVAGKIGKLKKEGGAIEKNMSKSEIKKLIAQGYVIEEI